MSIGVIGRKAGMTRVFTDDGTSIPVTVVQVDDNRIAQVRTEGTDGYRAVQLASGSRRTTRVSKAMTGHFESLGIGPAASLKEFRLEEGDSSAPTSGDAVGVEIFEVGQSVDVRGTTKGRGFSGGIRRHHFRGQDTTHGNSLSHRAPGSIGQCQTPGRVFKGKRMAGQHGNTRRCQQNLEIVRIDADRRLILLKGSVPGPTGGELVIVRSVKTRAQG